MSTFAGLQDSIFKRAASGVAPSPFRASKIGLSRPCKARTPGVAAGWRGASGVATPMRLGIVAEAKPRCAFGKTRKRNFDRLALVFRPAGRVFPSMYLGEYLMAVIRYSAYLCARINVGTSPEVSVIRTWSRLALFAVTSRKGPSRSTGRRILLLLLGVWGLPAVLARAQLQGDAGPRPDDFKLSVGVGGGYT